MSCDRCEPHHVINNFSFMLSSTWPEDSVSGYNKIAKLSSNPRSISNNNISVATKSSPMTRSLSQDINVGTVDSSRPKSSHSDTSLDAPAKPKPLRQTTIKEQPCASVEDDICSTDSSLMDEDIKKKKKKLFVFSKKNKGKNDWLKAALVGWLVSVIPWIR